MENATWKVADLAGLEVVTEEGRLVGILKDVFGTGANDVFIVQNGEQEVLIPALKTVVLAVSLSEKKITVRLPPGLEEIYAPKKAED